MLDYYACTLSHCFLTVQRWKKLGDLTTEDVLRTLSKDQRITEISKKKLASKIRVYNLSVIGCHTYVVGKAGVIVTTIAIIEEETALRPEN